MSTSWRRPGCPWRDRPAAWGRRGSPRKFSSPRRSMPRVASLLGTMRRIQRSIFGARPVSRVLLEHDLLVELEAHHLERTRADGLRLLEVRRSRACPRDLQDRLPDVLGNQVDLGERRGQERGVRLLQLEAHARRRRSSRSRRCWSTNGLYIGDLSPIVASNEKITSSTVTGLPSCKVMPERSTTSTVVGSTQVTDFGRPGLRQAIGPDAHDAVPDEVGHPAVGRARDIERVDRVERLGGVDDHVLLAAGRLGLDEGPEIADADAALV